MKAIRTKHHGPTDTKPARLSATTGERGQTIIFSRHKIPDKYDSGMGNGLHAYAARQLADKYGWNGELIGGGFPDGTMVWVFAESMDRA
jgi:hypothetical protein